MTEWLDIVCWPDAPWDFALWTNRQQIMSRLPGLDPSVRVLYVSSAEWVGDRVRGKRYPSRNLPKGEAVGRSLERAADRFWVLTPRLLTPPDRTHRTAPAYYDRFIVRTVQRACRRLGFDAPVLWGYGPHTAPLVGALNETLFCYDVVDDYASIPGYQSFGPGAAQDDAGLTAIADVVFTTSPLLTEERSQLNPNTHYVGNAGDIDLFRDDASGPSPELASLPRPLVIHHGALASYKLDLELIAAIAARRPGWSFVFVGPIEDDATRAALAAIPNITHIGYRPVEQLPPLLRAADVALLPSRRSSYIERSNALKVFECLAVGLPVVASEATGFGDVHPDVRLASTPDEFVTALEEVIATDDDAARRRRSASIQHSGWADKAQRQFAIVRDALAAKANR